ncbi:cytochrome c biogenesis CcdA family protein [Lolliginicoccus suaedae]|uniref:cytochrome c biogenesis CcdA family protein n=1 Tax=Lolliginicoccus suaedae TaxID=2605429 RepID=UPI0011EC8836|nr:cytochrome c biogenesis protein CcdA [Lolliginicoccus suaedae]
MDLAALGFALAAGMVAAFNPCGFAMLPAYLTLVIAGEDSSDEEPGLTRSLGRALTATAAMTAGFLAVFGAAGLIITPLASQAARYLPFVTVVIGLGLIGLGAWLLAGRELTVMLPKMRGGSPTGHIGSMFSYGLAYATASLSCTIGPFLAVTAVTFRGGTFLDGLVAFLAYGTGMAVVVGILAIAIVLAGSGLVQSMRRLLPHVNRIAGGLMLAAGAYVAYYGVWELRLIYSDGPVVDPIVDGALSAQQFLAGLVDSLGVVGVLTIAALLAAGLAATVLLRAQRREPAGSRAER